jgi:thiol-disulfide isomerase/thioredoxin
MKILKAIGRFFASIGRWIRDTAWVQPLLIVGGIFALIFSIPYIVQGIQSMFENGDAAENYYKSFQLSLIGSKDGNSDADKLMEYIFDREDGTASSDQINKYGDKFFLSFVKTGCEGCKEAQPGFETLQKNWTGIEDKNPFKLYTVFVDQAPDSNDDEGLQGTQTMFQTNFFGRWGSFFEQATTIAENRPYYDNQGGAGSGYGQLLPNVGDAEEFQTPTTFLVDWSYVEHDTYGISELIFNYDGKKGTDGTVDNTSFGLAATLRDCWNHAGEFSNDRK